MDRILIVEDDRMFREIFSDLLKSRGYDVETASCGSDGLNMLTRQRFDLVITDLLMPDISGMELLSRVKEHDPSMDVIMVTGNANLESAIFALKHGARDYLVKPVNADEFLHAVSQCLEQRRLLDENHELKSMLHLYQTSQTIAGCLEIERIFHLLLDAIAREAGANRGFGLFNTDHGLELKEVKGLTQDVAGFFCKAVLEELSLTAAGNNTAMNRICFGDFTSASEAVQEAGINEACLFFLRDRSGLHGIVVIFNDCGQSLADFSAGKKNIYFLLEQSLRAFENAKNYSMARNMLFIDDLSGLFNHRYLEVALERELKRIERYASQLAVLFLDMDSFKQVNDRHGHFVGSRVLREMGALLKRSVRDLDVVIRYGGDEYTIILVETGPEAAQLVAERIRAMVASHAFLADEGLNISLTCSIGYSCCPEDTLSKQELLEMADNAMYVSKNSGKNCVNRIRKTV